MRMQVLMQKVTKNSCIGCHGLPQAENGELLFLLKEPPPEGSKENQFSNSNLLPKNGCLYSQNKGSSSFA